MARPGKHKAKYDRYKASGHTQLNKIRKAETHKRRMERFAKRKEEGKCYEYSPNPYKKESEEYILESNKRQHKNVNKQLPLQRWTSIMRKLDDYILEKKKEAKRKAS